LSIKKLINEGVNAKKISYNNVQINDALVRLSEDLNTLYLIFLNQCKVQKCKTKQYSSLSYGPLSSAFEAH
jgi:hypothetical protein